MEYDLEEFNIAEPTKTEQTKKRYMARALQLCRRVKKELQIPEQEELDVRQLVVWLNDYKPFIVSRTWRQYKSSVIYFLENHTEEQAASEALEYLKPITAIGTSTYTEKTSSLKLKKISLEDWYKLDTFLKKYNRKWYEELRFWLRASIITGLRPVEWKHAQFFMHEKTPALKIQNAKHTNGRSNGPTRTILLQNLQEADLIAIKTHLNNVRTFEGMGEYDFFYHGCAVALHNACKKCWPRRKKHITLYSTRHQFSANAKSSGMSRLEVAALMGHAVDETAGAHYGRKQAGNEKIGVAPLAEEVNTVRKTTIDDFKGKINKTNDHLISK